MPIYTGKSADGSDMTLAQGVHTSPCGKFWSADPWPESRRERRKLLKELKRLNK